MHDYRPSGANMPWTNRERNHYEIGLLITFFLTGIAGLVLPRQTSSNTLLTMSTELIYVWQSVSAIGGALGLLGTVLATIPKRWLIGQVLLRFGLGVVALLLSGYGLAVLGLFNLRALFVGAILVSFAWAAWRRVWKISQDVAEFRKALQSQMEGADELGHRPPYSGSAGRTGGTDRSPLADPEDEGGNRKDIS
jgi:hypothetical protein